VPRLIVMIRSHVAKLVAPLMAAAAFSVAVIVAAVVLLAPRASDPGYVRGLSGLLALAFLLPCFAQLLALADAARAILRRESSRHVWRRVAAELIVAGLLIVLLALPITVAATPAGWSLVALPLAGLYALLVGPRTTRSG
jgi:hypothetical protein